MQLEDKNGSIKVNHLTCIWHRHQVKNLDELYQHAWVSGLKTTYYLRSLGATNAERSTVTDGALNAVGKACSIDNPDCEACQ